MSEAERMITVNVQVVIAGSHPSPIVCYQFFELPRVGELLHIHFNGDDLCLRVTAVDHFGHAVEDEVVDVGSTLLTCVEVI